MSTVKTVYNVTLVDEDDGNYRVEIFLKGALYKMVRNMVGTAIAVGRGHESEQDFQTFLNPQRAMTRDDNCCKPAPPQGLINSGASILPRRRFLRRHLHLDDTECVISK